MNEITENKVSKWAKLKGELKGREYWVGIVGIALTVGIVVAVIFYWEEVRALEGYGYAGVFLVSVFGDLVT